MPFVPASNTLQARLHFNWGTQQIENSLYFQGSAGVTPALATSLGTALVSWWSTNFRANTSNLMALNNINITDLTAENSFVVVHQTGLPLVGQDTAEALPFNCAFCVSLRSANRGRSGRGRNYIAGLTETKQAASVIDATLRTNIVAAYNLLVGAGTFVPGLQLVIVSRFHLGLPRAAALVQPVTTVLSVDSTMDSQRRRLPGRGR